MTLPDDKRRKNPVDRFRKILSAEKEAEPAPEPRKPAVVNLPKARQVEDISGAEPTQSSVGAEPGKGVVPRGALPIFWTAASIVSLIVNVVLIFLLMGLSRSVGAMSGAGGGPGLIGGIYNNLEELDAAHIKAVLPVQSDLALNASVPVQTSTRITLARDASIQGAHVKINTAGLNIDAPASVTLPAGTTLDVGMDFSLPLQANVPVAMDIPVDIAIQSTDLHPAILGLQQNLKPLLCATTPGAVSLSGAPLCR